MHSRIGFIRVMLISLIFGKSTAFTALRSIAAPISQCSVRLLASARSARLLRAAAGRSADASSMEDENRDSSDPASFGFSDPIYDPSGYEPSFGYELSAMHEMDDETRRALERELFSSDGLSTVPKPDMEGDISTAQPRKATRKPLSDPIPLPKFSIFEGAPETSQSMMVRKTSATSPASAIRPLSSPPPPSTPSSISVGIQKTSKTVTARKTSASALQPPSSPSPPPALPKEKDIFPSQRSRDAAKDQFLVDAAYGSSGLTLVETLEIDLERVTKEIYAENNGNVFNINSNKQVALVLYGPHGGSTEKERLEARAASGHRMSDLILKYRALKRDISRMKTKKELAEKGLRVKSASRVARASPQQDGRSYEQAADPLILVDASAYIFRAYYSMPPIHRGDGMPTGAVLGFCNMLNRLALDDMINGKTPRLVLVFDAPGKSFRSEIYPDYKGNRPAAPIDLVPQFPFVRQAATAYGIARIEAVGYEADDLIATLACQALREGIDVNIFSGDKDLMQLVTDKDELPSVQMIDPGTMSRVTYDEVLEKWGLPPHLLGDLLALAGDSADNVPGVPGIGPKIAAQLIQEHGSLENLYDNVDQIKQKARKEKLIEFKEQALLSRQLVELDRNVPWELMSSQRDLINVRELRMEPMDPDRILAFYDAMGFNDIKRRFQNSLNRGQPPQKRPINNNSKWRRPKADVPKPEDFEDVPF